MSGLPPRTRVRVTGTIRKTGQLNEATLGLTPENAELRRELARVIPFWLFHPAIIGCEFEETTTEVEFELDMSGWRERYVYVRPDAIARALASETRLAVSDIPMPVKKISPTYPEEARRMRPDEIILGTYISVAASGEVTKVSVLPHALHRFFAPTTEAALSQWQFAPFKTAFCGFISIGYKLK